MNPNLAVWERPPSEVRNEMASAWMKRGIALLSENTTASLTESLPCFERAIELRRLLPLGERPWYGYVLAAGWMNRGDALTRLGSSENLAEAVRSYDQALALLQSLPLKNNLLFRKRLALAWMNRGVTLQAETTPASLPAALASFEAAIATFRQPEALESAEECSILAASLTNRGNALLGLTPAAPEVARESAEAALRLLAEVEEHETLAAETALKARHVLCRAIADQLAHSSTTSAREDLVAAATDAADDGLKLARNWGARGEHRLRAVAEELFRFGVRVYQIHQPHFLAEFILENLDPAYSPDALPIDPGSHEAAREAIDRTVAEIQGDLFGSINTPQFGRLLTTLRQLRIARTRLSDLRCEKEEQRSSCELRSAGQPGNFSL